MENVKSQYDEIKVNDEVAEENQEQQKESNLTLEQFLEILKNGDNEITKYYHSTIDSQVNKRLEKRIKAYEEQQKTKAEEEKRVSAEQQKIKDYERKIETLENTIKYKSIIEKSGLNTDLIDFLANGTTTEEEVIKNIDRFKELLKEEVRKEISKKWKDNPIPEKSEGDKSNKKNKLWNI